VKKVDCGECPVMEAAGMVYEKLRSMIDIMKRIEAVAMEGISSPTTPEKDACFDKIIELVNET